MNRYLTTYRSDLDKVEAFTESDDYKNAVWNADDWVWQYAENPEQAKAQHFDKLDEWEQNPDKETY
jgi:hypothetical protein